MLGMGLFQLLLGTEEAAAKAEEIEEAADGTAIRGPTTAHRTRAWSLWTIGKYDLTASSYYMNTDLVWRLHCLKPNSPLNHNDSCPFQLFIC